MLFFDVEPRSREWFDLRIGAATSSSFDKILTPSTLKPSAQRLAYMNRLLAEWIIGEELEDFSNGWTIRGQEFEDKVWEAYENFKDTETERGGYFCTADKLVGCSPDRRVGKDGLVECKAPSLPVQVAYALNGGPQDSYKLQLQGQLWLAERDWCDIFAWHPGLFVPPKRVYRNEKVIAALQSELAKFIEHMLKAREFLERNFGPFVRADDRKELSPDDDTLGVSDDDIQALIDAGAINAKGEPW